MGVIRPEERSEGLPGKTGGVGVESGVSSTAPSTNTLCFINPTKVTTMRSIKLIPAGNISRNARRGRETMPIFALRYRASGVKVLSVVRSWK